MTSTLEDSMDFTLKYAGELKSGQSPKAKAAKHEIRLHFHRQLAALWRTHSLLKDWPPEKLQRPSSQERGRFNVMRPVEDRGLFWKHEIGGWDFIPLVNHVHHVHCHLSIRLHRPQERGSILYEGGDVDNGLKVLLDAFSMPQENQVIPRVGEGEAEPLYCLLESDDLVTKLSVESCTLLTAPDGARNYADMDVDVHIEPITPMMANIGMLFP